LLIGHCKVEDIYIGIIPLCVLRNVIEIMYNIGHIRPKEITMLKYKFRMIAYTISAAITITSIQTGTHNMIVGLTIYAEIGAMLIGLISAAWIADLGRRFDNHINSWDEDIRTSKEEVSSMDDMARPNSHN